MSPIRIIIIAVLLYIGYRLIFGGKKKSQAEEKITEDNPQQPIEDVLVEDPVCHNLVPKQQAVQLDHNGEKIYFCSDECCKKFVAEKGEDR